jgi:hypothetical protein
MASKFDFEHILIRRLLAMDRNRSWWEVRAEY